MPRRRSCSAGVQSWRVKQFTVKGTVLGGKKELRFYRKVRISLDLGFQGTVKMTDAQLHVVQAGNILCF